MSKVLQVDCSTGSGNITKNFGANHSEAWLYVDVALNALGLTALLADSGADDIIELDSSTFEYAGAEWFVDSGPLVKWAAYNNGGAGDPSITPVTPSPAITSLQFYRVKMHIVNGTPITQTVWIDGVSLGTVTVTGSHMGNIRYLNLFQPGMSSGAGGYLYFDNVKVGTTDGGTDIFSDDFESGNLSAWTSADAVFSVVDDPGITPAGTTPPPPSPSVTGRVLIAWDDGPLVVSPTWTAIDQGGSTFPYDFVSGYDTRSGRQTLISQTETGTATVYVNDRSGLLDDRNGSSPFQGKLSGRQIMLQIHNPVTSVWEPQFRGLIEDYQYTMDGSAVGADGQPVNATIQINAVDMFDYLNGYGLTPSVDGVTPPSGAEDSVYYAATSSGVDSRILEILTDACGATWAAAMSFLASGNVQVIATQYNPDESALTALRDAADAEMPFIGNIYVNREGLFNFRGRYSRFAPDAVKAAGGGSWDFTRWPVGDGKAIQSDPTRAQVRLLSYSRDRTEIINAALCYPMNTQPADIPGQVFANAPSITAYGKHEVSPLSDLITSTYIGPGTITPSTGLAQCALYAELLVKNKKDPRLCPTAVQLKSINTSDFRASATWGVLTQSDIGHIVNIAVGYPGGTGLTGGATQDDYYIEGRSLVVRPANSSYDYVELNLEVTPFIWSADTSGVFPAFGT